MVNKEKDKKKEARKTVRIFAMASFLNDLGSDMIYPVWPLFITTVIGANMAVLGLLDGLGLAVVSLSQAASGYFSDKLRRRKVFIWSGYLLGSISRVGYALSTIWQHLVPLRILDRAGKVRSAPRDAIVADISTEENMGKNFGLLRAADHLGAVCGIIICILFFEMLGYRNLFLIAAVPSVVGALLIFTLLKEQKPQPSQSGGAYKGLKFKDLGGNFKLFLLVSALFSLGSFSYSFLLIYAMEFGFEAGFVPVMYLVFTAVASVSSLPFGRLSDKAGRKSVLILSFVLWGLVCLIFILFHSYGAITFAFVLYGLHLGALQPVQKAFVSELAPARFRASGLGGFQMVVGICALPASVFAGLFWEGIGMFVPLYFSITLTVLAIVMLVFVKEKAG